MTAKHDVTARDSSDFQERAARAVLMLSAEVSEESESSAVSLDDIESCLPDSYCIYSSYFPMYPAIKDEYVRAAMAVLDEANESLDFLFVESVKSEESEYTTLVSSDTAVADLIRREHYDEFVSLLESMLKSSESLSGSFNASYRAFCFVGKSYKRLSDVGFSLELPEPEPIDTYSLSVLYVNAYFSRLAGFERSIKNQRVNLDSDSAYSIFWEE